MGIIFKICAFILNIPARLKGVKFGKGSFFGPGYDFLSVKMRGIVLGDNVLIGRNAWIELAGDDKNAKVEIGDGTNIGRGVMISSAKNISVGKKCLISYNVSMLDHDHCFVSNVSPMDSGITDPSAIKIGDNCFIGAHSFILKGVHLGEHCVVGANSVVTKSFPDNSIVAGSPARQIKTNALDKNK